MKKVINQTIETLLEELKGASDILGIPSENMIRTWCPEFAVSSLSPEAGVYLAVFLQDCRTDTEEMQAGVMKTVSLRIAVLKRLSEAGDDEVNIQQTVECFEALQNFLTGFRSWKAEDDQEFTITKAEPAGIADPETLTAYRIADCGFDLEIQTFVPYPRKEK